MQRSTSIETINCKAQVERNKTSTTEKEKNNTTLQNTTIVVVTRLTTSLLKFETVNRLFGSVNTSSKQQTFFTITVNRLEEKTNKKYRHIERISVKGLTKKFNQVIKEDSFRNTTFQTNNFVLQPMFTKSGNSNKFQIEAEISKKKTSKFLKKMDRPPKATKEDTLKKYNPDILDKINNKNSVVEIVKQKDNTFVINQNETNLDDNTEDIKNSELGLLNRIRSPSPEQDSSITDWSNKLTDSKGKQDCRVIKEIKGNSTSKNKLNKYGFNV
ncbi:hypothetical protein G9A89_006945 [Geosiphon pyriformis]|nr:hypothetical protein G9A89_006945 [Geosiphon pyriformis]